MLPALVQRQVMLSAFVEEKFDWDKTLNNRMGIFVVEMKALARIVVNGQKF